MAVSEVFICKASLTFKACFDDFKEQRVENDGLVNNEGNKRRSIPKSFGEIVYFQNVEIFKGNGKKIAGEDNLADTAASLKRAYLNTEGKKTNRRSDWETTRETFMDIAKFECNTDREVLCLAV